MTTPAAAPHPLILAATPDSPVFLRDQGQAEHFSRVIATLPNAVVVQAPPTFPHSNIGITVDLLWIDQSGVHATPASIIGVGRAETGPTLTLAPLGRLKSERRRNSIRVPLDAPITVAADDAACVSRGRTIDVTDGAVQCTLDGLIQVGAAVRFRLTLAGEHIRLLGTVIAIKGTDTTGHRTVIGWPTDQPAAVHIRSYIHDVARARGL